LGFTLIELLIVIAIILILIAIALPNFLNAQIRARATKATAELRSIGTALEAYYLDWGVYPGENESTWSEQSANEHGLKRLTTPISYITSIPEDPFPAKLNANYDVGELRVYYGGGCWTKDLPYALTRSGPIYAVWSRGPAETSGGIRATVVNVNPYGGEIVSYSPTNGTKSVGSIHLFAGEGVWWGLNTEESSTSNICDPKKLKDPSLMVGLMVDKKVYYGTRPPNSWQ
ncbi:MAG: type II secretion system protein GspG, partial [Candidatus Omnitrophica bacterium]|nr:type II secretion system protein GspG [Candidatus Omnitrophota bacterium]